jgi:hypothetical protein
MKNIVMFVVFVVGVVLVQFAQGQSVDEVINKYLDARGGKDKLKAIQSVYMEGARQMMGNEIPVKVTMVNGKLFRTDFEFSGANYYTIVTPTAGWSLTPRSPSVETIPADRLKTMQGQLDIAGALVDYAAKGSKVELAGKSRLNGNDVTNVKLTMADGKTTTYSFDSKTGLLSETKSMATGMGQGGKLVDREVVTDYSDYKAVDGILFPHTIANPGAGQAGGGSTTFDKIELNKPVDDAMYKPGK